MQKMNGLIAVLGSMFLASCGVPTEGERSGIALNGAGDDAGVASDCTLTQGYWKNHASAWAVTSLTLGSVSYDQQQLLDILNTRHPKRIEVCALLDKPSRREVDVKARWIGFEIPDKFVVGYGIDYAQRNRNLPHIGAVRFIDQD